MIRYILSVVVSENGFGSTFKYGENLGWRVSECNGERFIEIDEVLDLYAQEVSSLTRIAL